IVSQIFDPEKHYIPLFEGSSVEKLLYNDSIEKKIGRVFSKAQRLTAEENWDEAVEAFTILLKENPDLGIAHAGLGSTLIAKGDYAGAVTHLNQAVELLPEEMDIRAQLGGAMYLTGNTPSAIQTLHTALDLSPENVNVLLKLIDIVRAENQIDQVVEYTLRAVKVAPANPKVLVAFGRLGIDSDNQEVFKAAFDKLKQISPDHPVLKEWQEAMCHSENTPVFGESQTDRTEENVPFDQSQSVKPMGIKELTSLVIVLSNDNNHLEQCMACLREHTAEPYEVFIFSNGVNLEKVSCLREDIIDGKKWKLDLTAQQVELAGVYNQALKKVSGDHIVFISDQVMVTKDWLTGLLECLNSAPKVGLVGPMTVNVKGPQSVSDETYNFPDDLEPFAASFRTENRYRRIPTSSLSPVCLLFKRDLVEEIGFFDETLKGKGLEWEDYGNRISLEGYSQVIAGDVFVHNVNKPLLINKKLLTSKWSGIDLQTDLGKKIARFNAIRNAKDYYQEGQPEKALESLIEGITYCPEEKMIYQTLSEILIDDGRFSEGLEALNGLPEAFKQEPLSLVLFGYCLQNLGNLEEAQEYGHRALGLLTDYPPGLNLLGLVARKKGDLTAAEAFFEKAMESDPGYGEPHSNFAELLWQKGDKERALIWFEKGFILSPTVSNVHSFYLAVINELGRFNQAEKTIRNAVHLYPKHKKLSFSFISVLLAQDKHLESMQEIERAMITFGMDEGILTAALEVRNIMGPLEINKTASDQGTLSVCLIVKNEEEN
ncbi:MAG: hypothetical protein C0407_12870, partial [Desulfobacca sp.]|nr:hypothetical protein [Desulfobacca sp.]